ncbi:28739_t:CDS:2, partial [Racocetra persica]
STIQYNGDDFSITYADGSSSHGWIEMSLTKNTKNGSWFNTNIKDARNSSFAKDIKNVSY